MALKTTTLAIALAAAGFSMLANTASADNNNPCFQTGGAPAGAAYWSTGPYGPCKPFNTYHAENKDPVAQVDLPAVNQQFQPRKKLKRRKPMEVRLTMET